MKLKGLLVSGGVVSEQLFLKHYAKGYDCVIGVDGGCQLFVDHQCEADYYLGDFDSLPQNTYDKLLKQNKPIDKFQSEKEFTDTHLALMKAMELGCIQIDILGATGTRMDHTLANIMLLEWALTQHMEVHIINDTNNICLIDDQIEIEANQYKYISIIPLDACAEGVTTTHLKYPLDYATLKRADSRGISNEIIGPKAKISVQSGKVWIIQSND